VTDAVKPRDARPERPSARVSGLALTALYTSEVWYREGFPGAALLASKDVERVELTGPKGEKVVLARAPKKAEDAPKPDEAKKDDE